MKHLFLIIMSVLLILSSVSYIRPVYASTDGYKLSEAESFISRSGSNLKVEACPDGGQNVGGTNDNQYLEYGNFDFGSGINGATNFSARVAVKGSNAGGDIEIWIDSPNSTNGKKVGTLSVTATAPDNWNVYQTMSTGITEVTGVHNVYLVLKVAVGKTYVANINWFQFSKSLNSISLTKLPTKTSYRIGESLDLTGLEVTGTYIDGTKRVEEIRASDVSGINSSSATTNQTLTLTIRGKKVTYSVNINP
ncbi:carbohydrate-binding protein [Gottfriedia acidiceleris]|uniref:Carbohydrate-binding protein n=1 Tax=Gottfriedia acidiceleris TaxID=371036 RepID=A0ABY4JR62_9BACI|nr:carbohydrate-binding protein [Gottfriedia acidiceleris]UPM56323.1 carbohydrate-binding protein [Gottfriedia acidiceleris]